MKLGRKYSRKHIMFVIIFTVVVIVFLLRKVVLRKRKHTDITSERIRVQDDLVFLLL